MASSSTFLTKFTKFLHKNGGEAMNTKNLEIVHSGWMTKSPPEKKILGPLRLFRSKWKKRYFVLCKPLGSLPGQYELSYYNDEQCTRKKGSIDLDQCEQIIESLDSNQFPYLLAIKTVFRSKERTYYLATSSEEDMAKWVGNLCSVCGLKQEDSPTDIPERKKPFEGQMRQSAQVSSQTPGSGANASSNSASAAVSIPTHQSKKSTPSIGILPTSHDTSSSSMHNSTESDAYIPLQECNTGTLKDRRDINRQESIDSIPDELAPPPPLKTHQARSVSPAHQDGVFTDDVYVAPPPAKPSHVSFDQFYMSPPVHHDRNHPSNLSSNSSDSHSSAGLANNSLSRVPKTRSVPSSEIVKPTVYDVPPTPVTDLNRAGPLNDYQNLPSTGGSMDISAVVPVQSNKEQHLSTISSYDIPRSSRACGISESFSPPPPPCPRGSTDSHSYVNALPTSTDVYLAMDKGKERESAYTNMDSSFEDHLVKKNDIYEVPPTHPQLIKFANASPKSQAMKDEDAHTIWSSTRTKSFKRHNYTNSPVNNHGTASLPKREIMKHENSKVSQNPVHLEKVFGVESIIPAPAEERELKYIDLALDETPVKGLDSLKDATNKYPGFASTPTEYKEIDFVKTEALSNTKKWGDDQRQLFEKQVHERTSSLNN